MNSVSMLDGRKFTASPLHPLFDGKPIYKLKMGDIYDGSMVKTNNLVFYDNPLTYDILPAGDTGNYWVNGTILGSTLFNLSEKETARALI